METKAKPTPPPKPSRSVSPTPPTGNGPSDSSRIPSPPPKQIEKSPIIPNVNKTPPPPPPPPLPPRGPENHHDREPKEEEVASSTVHQNPALKLREAQRAKENDSKIGTTHSSEKVVTPSKLSPPPPPPPRPKRNSTSEQANNSPVTAIEKARTTSPLPDRSDTPVKDEHEGGGGEGGEDLWGKSILNMRRMTMNLNFKSAAFLERRKSVQTKSGEEELAILVGTLSKRNREGNFDKCIFTLTKEALLYQKQAATANTIVEGEPIQENECKTIPIASVIVCELRESDYKDNEKRDRAFRVLSKQKSFLARAKTIEMKEEWFRAIESAANQARVEAGLPSFHESEMAPIWEPNETSCSLCLKPFSFFVRKHHCRNCGCCVCELCSKDKVRIPKLDEFNLYKVCNHCSKQLKELRVYGFQADLN